MLSYCIFNHSVDFAIGHMIPEFLRKTYGNLSCSGLHSLFSFHSYSLNALSNLISKLTNVPSFQDEKHILNTGIIECQIGNSIKLKQPEKKDFSIRK